MNGIEKQILLSPQWSQHVNREADKRDARYNEFYKGTKLNKDALFNNEANLNRRTLQAILNLSAKYGFLEITKLDSKKLLAEKGIGKATLKEIERWIKFHGY